MRNFVSWFARNGVVANLLMFSIAGGGLLATRSLRMEVFPEISVDMINIAAEYRGATPEEVEQAVCVRIEEAVQGLQGVRRVVSLARPGAGAVAIEVEIGRDVRRVIEEVKTRVEGITSFPADVERPVIQEVTNRVQVINVSVWGDTDERTLRRLSETVRDDLLRIPNITLVELKNARPYEISIEVSEGALRRSGLSFDQVAEAVRRTSLDMPGGSLKSDQGEILLRTQGQAHSGREFERINLVTRPDGSRIRLGDIAKVTDGFESTDRWTYMDGRPAMLIKVFRTGDQSAIEIADAVHDYLERTRASLPPGIEMTAWSDSAKVLKDRIDLLLRNGLSGLALVFVVLALFLRLRLAFWVTLGIPVSFLGTLMAMNVLDVSVNMISLFAFILVLGIIVDDAIVVGESIVAKRERAASGEEAAVRGARAVAIPVVFGVLTTVAAFAPLLFLDGYMGRLWRVVPLIVIPALVFSLIESQLVLPSHLAGLKPGNLHEGAWYWHPFRAIGSLFDAGLKGFVEWFYRPVLGALLRVRYLVVVLSIGLLYYTVTLVRDGTIPFVFFPDVESDIVAADLTLLQETPSLRTAEGVRALTTAALDALEEIERIEGKRVYKHILTTVGEQPFTDQANRNAGGAADFAKPNEGEVIIELIPSEERNVSAAEIARRWRARAPEIPDMLALTFSSSLVGGANDIEVQFAGRDFEALKRAAAATKAYLAGTPGVIDITDSYRSGKPEIKLDVTPRAASLGVTRRDLARQVRQGFAGEEVQRLQRGSDEVRVVLRYPDEDRRSLNDLSGIRLRTPDGREVPFSTAAVASMGRGFDSIRRVDRQRTISVTADVDPTQASANAVIANLEQRFLPQLLQDNPNLFYSFEGEQRTQRESLTSLAWGLAAALFVIYVLLATPFKSYWQPVIVMSAVPFGFVGAGLGHLALGHAMSIFSLCGVVALAGVAVNDSLVLVDFINRARGRKRSLRQAAVEAGARRFRPVWLTSLTTVAGLAPLILEKQVQAQFLIPMAVSLAAGVLFCTVTTLVLVPSIYLILEDVLGLFRAPEEMPALEPAPAFEQGPAFEPGPAMLAGDSEGPKKLAGSSGD